MPTELFSMLPCRTVVSTGFPFVHDCVRGRRSGTYDRRTENTTCHVVSDTQGHERESCMYAPGAPRILPRSLDDGRRAFRLF